MHVFSPSQHSDSSREIQHLINKLEIERSETNRNLSGIDNKIDKEIATLMAKYERYRNDLMKYAAGKALVYSTLKGQ